MGWALKDVEVRVGLICLREDTLKIIDDRLRTRGDADAGRFVVTPYPDLLSSNEALKQGQIDAICIGFKGMSTEDLVAFIGNTRVSYPFVPVCLVGPDAVLKALPGLTDGWRNRLNHYYKIYDDKNPNDLAENIGLIRDLFVADAVKTRAMGVYDTTPGRIIQLKHALPAGTWISAMIGFAGALTGAIASSIVTYLLSKH